MKNSLSADLTLKLKADSESVTLTVFLDMFQIVLCSPHEIDWWLLTANVISRYIGNCNKRVTLINIEVCKQCIQNTLTNLLCTNKRGMTHKCIPITELLYV